GLASAFTVQHMLERDLFEKRLQDQKPLYLHEFLYPVMQGYDSVAMNVDVEIGGTDQTFNMLAGRMLLQKMRHKEKIVVATTLLENPKTGEKLMSKSLGNFIALDETARSMFGKIMALPDEVVEAVFFDCTLLPEEKIKTFLSMHPKEAKKALAKEIVRMYHGEKSAAAAASDFESAFSKGEAPADTDEIELKAGLREALLEAGIIASNAEFKRLGDAGAIRVVGEDTKIYDPSARPFGKTLRIGKHRFVRIRNETPRGESL
ncbi:MAG: tyrosine--tRNA ligase, partial [Patescibacteria group bacterium]|nr:tyrosine--tRNA ligase [Patescibacteria group bacterium]